MAILKQGRIFYWGKGSGFSSSKGWQEGWMILKSEDETSPSWGPSLNYFKDSTCRKQIGKPIQLLSLAADIRFRTSAVKYGPPKKKDARICPENLIAVPLSPNKQSIAWLCAFSVPELRKWLSAVARSLEGLANAPELPNRIQENGLHEHENGEAPTTAVEVNGTVVNKLYKTDSLHDLLSAETHKPDADWALYWWNMPETDPTPSLPVNDARDNLNSPTVASETLETPAENHEKEVAKTTEDNHPSVNEETRAEEKDSKSNQRAGNDTTENLSKDKESRDASEDSPTENPQPVILASTSAENGQDEKKEEAVKSEIEEERKESAVEVPEKPLRNSDGADSSTATEKTEQSQDLPSVVVEEPKEGKKQEADEEKGHKTEPESNQSPTGVVKEQKEAKEAQETQEQKSETEEKSSAKAEAEEKNNQNSQEQVVTPRATLGTPAEQETNRQTVYFDSEQQPDDVSKGSDETTEQSKSSKNEE